MFECDYVVDMVRKVYAGRVTYHDGSSELAPGISVHTIGGHSKGLQCVRVKTKRGDVVLASDCAHLYNHIDQGRVFPITYNVGDVLEGYAKLKKLASSRDHIVPGHDPKVLDLYPAASDALKGWVARLDEAPKAVSKTRPKFFEGRGVMCGAVCREAAEHHARNAARVRRRSRPPRCRPQCAPRGRPGKR